MSGSVARNQNVLHFSNLSHPQVIGDIVSSLRELKSRAFPDAVLDFGAVDRVFPNTCAPLAGVIAYFREREDIDFSFTNVPAFLESTSAIAPRAVHEHIDACNASPLNTVWQFSDSAEVNRVTTNFVAAVSRAAVCQPGVLQALEWSLNEVMDNVLQHSGETFGLAMGQIHPTSNHIALCVFDSGRGLFNSLRTSHHPRNAVDAITLAVQEGVTRDKSVGQGNGLWGLHNIVRLNHGLLTITSGPGQYSWQVDHDRTYSKVPYPSLDHNSTTVDFQLDYTSTIELAEALGGYEPTNFRLEEIEDESGNVLFQLSEKASGTGTRRSGEALRNEITNIAGETKSVIGIDFGGISIVSSSFADEFIGKLVTQFGFAGFVQRFRLLKMNSTVEAIVNRSVAQRMGESIRR